MSTFVGGYSLPDAGDESVHSLAGQYGDYGSRRNERIHNMAWTHNKAVEAAKK